MFDIGFWEIMLISIIGLVVLGPQRLPVAIKSVLRWVNTAKSMANSVKNEISQELELQEMNENMIKATKQGLDNIDPELKASIDKMKSHVDEVTQPYQAKSAYQAAEETEHNDDVVQQPLTADKNSAPEAMKTVSQDTSQHTAGKSE